MTWNPDLSPYSYLPNHIPAGQTILNVGWLDSEHDFPAGDPPPGFVDALTELCVRNPQARTRGLYPCRFCTAEEFEYPSTVNIRGEKFSLGNAEVRVISENGTILTAPTLVAHYVERHRYLPPAEFVEAVLARRVVEDPEA